MISDELKSDFAEICGIHAGDGWLSSYTYEVGYGTSPKEEQYFQEVLRLYRKVFGIDKVRILRRLAVEFRFQSKSTQEILMSAGFPRGRKLDKLRTPEFILQDAGHIKRFLRGLVDTDGTVYWRLSVNRYNLTITWNTTSQQLADEIVRMLRNLSYNPQISSFKPKPTDGHIRRVINRIILMRHAEVKKFLEEIGFRNNNRWSQVVKMPKELERYHLGKINEPARIRTGDLLPVKEPYASCGNGP